MPRGRPSRAVVYARLEHALTELNERLGGLPRPEESKYVWSDIWHLEAHHSTALEGNTLVLREVEALLDRGRAVGAKPLAEYMEVRGYGEAAQWVYAQAGRTPDSGLVTAQEIREVHHRVMSPVWSVSPHPDADANEAPGNYRRHDIRPSDGGMTPPTWPLVDAEVSGWIASVPRLITEAGQGLALPERLAQAHNEFERIHPFLDGNGRTGRLVLNLLLVRLGYPPVIILKQQRAAYLSAMQAADRGDLGALGELLARAMLDNLNRFILPSVAGPARLVPLPALVDAELSLVALRAAARRGRLEAHQDGQGQWLSTRAAVDAYRASRQNKGRRTQ